MIEICPKCNGHPLTTDCSACDGKGTVWTSIDWLHALPAKQSWLATPY